METKIISKHFFLILLSLITALFIVAACGKGTEVGNPNAPEGEEPGAETPGAESYQTYQSADYHITCYYPSEWTYNEVADVPSEESSVDAVSAMSVTFAAGAESDSTNVVVYTDTLSSEPSNLGDFLYSKFPTWSFITYSTPYLNGYRSDNPIAGENGGDRNDLFFLNGNILLHVITESFGTAWNEENILIILDSLNFYEGED